MVVIAAASEAISSNGISGFLDSVRSDDDVKYDDDTINDQDDDGKYDDDKHNKQSTSEC